MTARTLAYRSLDDLVADPANPKAHALDTLGASVNRFGYVEPIVVDDRTGYLISGHGRRETLLAARDEGQEPPDGVQVAADGSWLVPVITGWSSKNDADARAALIALNRTGEVGGWDDGSLLALLERLADDEGGLTGVGYDEGDIEALQALLGKVEVQDRDLDGLMDEFGGPTDADGLRRVVLHLSPPIAKALQDAVDEAGSGDRALGPLLGLFEPETGVESA